MTEDALRGLPETRVATREESGVLGFPSRRGPRHDEALREPLVRRQGSQVSMRVARGSSNPVHQVSDAIQPSHLSSLLLLPSIFPSIRVFSNELALCIRWPCKIYFPDQGLNPGPLHWECGVLATGSHRPQQDSRRGEIVFRIKLIPTKDTQRAQTNLLCTRTQRQRQNCV